jgi:hypothetical protein
MEDPVSTPKKRYSHGHSSTAFNGGAGVVYGLGFVGAVIYFMQHAVGLWPILLAILKALVWPTFIVYNLLHNLLG